MRSAFCRRVSLIFASVVLLVAVPEKLFADETGIDGVISVSPNRPGPLRKGDTAESPVPETAFAVMKADVKVTTFITDKKGHFHLTLPPGHYVIKRDAAQPAIGQWQFEAEIVAGKMVVVKWTADSGMR